MHPHDEFPDEPPRPASRQSEALAAESGNLSATGLAKLAAELQAAIDDPRPSMTTDEVLAQFVS